MASNMKLFVLFIFFSAAAEGSLLAQSSQTKEVLFVGNSYTNRNNLPQVLADLASSLGDSLVWDANLIGGYTLQAHASNATTLALLDSNRWDAVFLQEQSQRPAQDPTQVATNVYPFAEQLVEAVRAGNPCSLPLFYMTWGRKDGDSDNCATYPPVCTYEGMQARLRDSYLEMGQQNRAGIAPVGVVWQRIRDLYPSMGLYHPDGSHPSETGSYLVACVMYAALYHRSPVGAGHPPAVPPTDAAILQTQASLVVLDSLMTWGIDTSSVQSDLLISGIFDGPLSSAPRGVEIFVRQDIADLSDYGLGSANNGGGSDGEEFTFPAVAASAGDVIYVTNDSLAFISFFGFAPDYEDPVSGISGDDAYELFHLGAVVDVFGEPDVDGTGTPWEYLDGWAYRKQCAQCAGGANFIDENWLYSGTDVFDGTLINADAALPYPAATYQALCPGSFVPALDSALLLVGLFDGPLSGTPKGVELLVRQDIPDLSRYGLGTGNNGEGSDGQEFTFPSVAVTAGEYLYVANDTLQFRVFFGRAANFEDGGAACNFNGNDGVELFEDGRVIDVYGDVDVDGSGLGWEYSDSWAHRVAGTGPDGSSFVPGHWTQGPLDVFDGVSTNDAAMLPYPIFVPACSADAAPSNLQSVVGLSSVILTWDPLPLAVACQVKGTRIVPPGPSPSLNLLGFETASTAVPVAVAGVGTTWSWQVRCACSISPLVASSFADPDTFLIPSPRVQVTEQRATLSPNPATTGTMLHWNTGTSASSQLVIFNATGRDVRRETLLSAPGMNTQWIDLAELPEGIYWLQLDGDDPLMLSVLR